MQYNYTQKDIQRFWGYVVKSDFPDDCWSWLGCSTQGYGQLKLGNKMFYAHRISYELTFGEIPEGLDVLHRCDNPSCCNPRHLVAGTHQDNMADMYQKNRRIAAHGEGHHAHKLTDEQVAEIRRRYSRFGIGGDRSTTLAKEFGVTRGHIWDIVNFVSRKQRP